MPGGTTVVLVNVKWDEMRASTKHGKEHHPPVGSDCYELSLFGITQGKSKAKSKVLAG